MAKRKWSKRLRAITISTVAGVVVSASVVGTALGLEHKNKVTYNGFNQNGQPILTTTTAKTFSLQKNLNVNLWSTSSALLFQSNFYNESNFLTALSKSLQALQINGQSQGLVVTNTYLGPHLVSSLTNAINLYAIQIKNPLTNLAVQLNFPHSFQIFKPGESFWITYQNGFFVANTQLNVTTAKTPLLSINTEHLLSAGNNQYKAPTIPTMTPYQLAAKMFADETTGKAVLTADFSAMVNWLNTTTDTKPLVVNYDGAVAKISFKNLQMSLNTATFIPSVNGNLAHFTIPEITGQLQISVAVSGKTLHFNLTINNTNKSVYANNKQAGNVDFAIQPVVFNVTNHKIVSTYPNVVNNNLGLTPQTSFNFAGASFNGTSTVFGYSVNSASTTNNDSQYLNLYNSATNAPFTTMNISWTYLFWNFWMASHPDSFTTFRTANAFGSIYQNGQTNLTSSQISLPTNWQNAFSNANNQQNILSDFITISNNSSVLTNAVLPNSTNTITVNLKNYPKLASAIYSQNPWLKQLNPALGVQVRITKTIVNDELTLRVTGFGFYNAGTAKTYLDSNYTQIYYVQLNTGTITHPVYETQVVLPAYPETCVSWFNVNLPVHLTYSSKSAININFSDFNLNIEPQFNSFYYNNDTALSALNASSALYTNFVDQLQNLINTQALTISNLKFQIVNNQLICTSLTVTNSTDTIVTINGQECLPHQSLTFSTHISVNGLVPIFSVNSSIDLQNFALYSNLLASNFDLTNTTANHLQAMYSALSAIFFDNQVSVVDYTTADSSNTSILTFATMTVKNTNINALYIDFNGKTTLLKPNATIILNDLTLTHLIQTLSASNSQELNSLMNETNNWLNTLTNQDIQNDFNLLKNVASYQATLPGNASVNYKNFACTIANYDQTTHTAVLNNFNWDISGIAQTGVSIDPTASFSVNVIANNVQFKLVPMLFYTLNGTEQSYPSINATASDKIDFAGIVSKDVAVATTLNYTNIPTVNLMQNIHFGYYLEPITHTNVDNTAGSGLALATNGTSASDKPSLNLSYAFNNFAMLHHYANNSIVPNVYGSLSSQHVTWHTPNPISINQYAEDTLTLPSEINATWAKNIYWLNFYNNLNAYNNTLSQTLALPAQLSITNFAFSQNLTTIESLTIKNNSPVTFKLIDNNQAAFVLPYSQNIVTFNVQTNLSQLLSYKINLNLTTLYNQNNSTVITYWHTTRYLADNFAYLYPLLWTENNYNCLTDSIHGYYWNQGTKMFTVDQSSWTADISAGDHPTIELAWVKTMLNLPANWNFTGYTINVQNNVPVIHSLFVNGQTINVNIILTPGSYFSLS